VSTTKTNILFAVHFARYWRNQEPLYNFLQKNSDFDVELILIKDLYSGPTGKLNTSNIGVEPELRGNEMSLFQWAAEEGLTFKSFTQELVDLKYLRSQKNFIIRQTHWDESFPNAFRTYSNDLMRYVYIPYEQEVAHAPQITTEQLLMRRASGVFVTSPLHERYYLDAGLSSRNVKATGSPRLQRLHQDSLKLQKNSKFRRSILWMPHHSVGNNWLNFGTFHILNEKMLQLARKMPETRFILRCHHLLWKELLRNQRMTLEDMRFFLRNWNSLENTEIDNNIGYEESYLASDILITDGISSLVEYCATGKPLVFIDRPNRDKLTIVGNHVLGGVFRFDPNVQVDKLQELLSELNTESSNFEYSIKQRQIAEDLFLTRNDAVQNCYEELKILDQENSHYM